MGMLKQLFESEGSLEKQDAIRIKSFLEGYGIDSRIENGGLFINKESEAKARNLITNSYLVQGYSIQFLIQKIIEADDNYYRKVHAMHLQSQIIRLSILNRYKNEIENMAVYLSHAHDGKKASIGIIVMAKKVIISKKNTKRIKDIARSIAPYVDYETIIVEWDTRTIHSQIYGNQVT